MQISGGRVRGKANSRAKDRSMTVMFKEQQTGGSLTGLGAGDW